MKKKTLIELLQESKYQKTNIKVGSKNGSSLWYCGKGNLAYSLPEIKRARTDLLQQSKGVLHQFQYRLEHLDEIYEEMFAKARKGKIKVKDYDKFVESQLKRKEREKVLIPKKMELVRYDISTHLLDREVKEVVEGISPDEKPCWIIYVKGSERGRYWTIKEYEKRRKLNAN